VDEETEPLDGAHVTQEATSWAGDLAFVHTVVSALLRVAAGCVMALADRLFNWVLQTMLVHAPVKFVIFLEIVGLVAFGLLYVYLLYDMICVFVPKLKGKRK
jgi:hypothetical protein